MKWVFWMAAGLIAYTYVGYPIWLRMRSHWAPRPVLRGHEEIPVTAVMVVRNEEAVLARKLENLLSLDYPQERFDVVVLSDGSTDSTPAILADFEKSRRVRALIKQKPQGKAAGLNDAMQLAAGEVVLFTDVRQQIEHGAVLHDVFVLAGRQRLLEGVEAVVDVSLRVDGGVVRSIM